MKAHWLHDGDRNTSFFHACALDRRRVNLIKSLKNDEGGVVEGEEERATTKGGKCPLGAQA